MSERRLLLPFLLLLFACRARAALEIDTRWQADSPEAIAAAVDAQAFQAALRRDVAQVYDAAGLPDMGVSAVLQATIIGSASGGPTTTTTPRPTTTPPPAPPPKETPAPDTGSVGQGVTIGAVVVAVAAFAVLGALMAGRGAGAPASGCADASTKAPPELPFKLVRPPPTAPEEPPPKRAYAGLIVYTKRGE
jgi:hypothetical protein